MENPGESRATVVSIVIIVTLGNDDAFARIKIESESTIEIENGIVAVDIRIAKTRVVATELCRFSCSLSSNALHSRD